MASQQLLVFAALICEAAATWPDETMEKLECCREWCRNICLKIGLGPTTFYLSHLWIAITCAQIQLCGLNPEDINESSMGVQIFDAPISDLSKMNPYEKLHYKECDPIVAEMLSLLRHMEPDLISHIQALGMEVAKAIAD